jgi:hypothetical protein
VRRVPKLPNVTPHFDQIINQTILSLIGARDVSIQPIHPLFKPVKNLFRADALIFNRLFDRLIGRRPRLQVMASKLLPTISHPRPPSGGVTTRRTGAPL